jgi:hypothetical protein
MPSTENSLEARSKALLSALVMKAGASTKLK